MSLVNINRMNKNKGIVLKIFCLVISILLVCFETMNKIDMNKRGRINLETDSPKLNEKASAYSKY